MFKKILIPTDGSPLSSQAANAGVMFARSVNAEVVALHVTQPFAATIGFDGMAAAYAITDDAYEKASSEQAAKYIDAVMSRADTADVKASARLPKASATVFMLSPDSCCWCGSCRQALHHLGHAAFLRPVPGGLPFAIP